MGKVTITLDVQDIHQVLDGLQARADAYRSTEEFFKSEELIWDGPVEEVTDAHEAAGIAKLYERIIKEISSQL